MCFLRFSITFLFLFFIHQVNADIRIGVIDTSKIVEKCNVYIEAKKIIEDKLTRHEKEAGEIEGYFAKKAEDLKNKQGIVEAKEYNAQKEELTHELESLQKKFYALKTNLDQEFEHINKTLNTKLLEIVQNLSEIKGMAIVLDKRMVLYNYQSLDITDEVVYEVNNKLRSIDDTFLKSKENETE